MIGLLYGDQDPARFLQLVAGCNVRLTWIPIPGGPCLRTLLVALWMMVKPVVGSFWTKCKEFLEAIDIQDSISLTFCGIHIDWKNQNRYIETVICVVLKDIDPFTMTKSAGKVVASHLGQYRIFHWNEQGFRSCCLIWLRKSKVIPYHSFPEILFDWGSLFFKIAFG